MSEVPVSPIVGEVLNARNPNQETIALVGYVGVGNGDPADVRLYPDADFARWMDIPLDKVVASTPVTTFGSGRLQRTVVWVDAATMLEPVFNEEAFDFAGAFIGSEISTWQLLPATRLVAAEMLDLLHDPDHDRRRA